MLVLLVIAPMLAAILSDAHRAHWHMTMPFAPGHDDTK
jgi:hypothetical protein